MLFDHVSIGCLRLHCLTGSSLSGKLLLLPGLLTKLYLELKLAKFDALIDVFFAESFLVFVNLGEGCDKEANDEYKAKEGPMLISIAVVDQRSFKRIYLKTYVISFFT